MMEPMFGSLSGWWLGLDAPLDASVSHWHITPDPTGIALAVVTLGACGAAAIYAYRSEMSATRTVVRTLLASLRIVALAFLCSWLFRPAGCGATLSGDQPRPVAIILDDSQSMRQADLRVDAASRTVARDAGLSEGCTRIELGKKLLEKHREAIERDLEGKGPVRWYLAGNDLERMPDAATAIERWTGSREGTDLAAAIDRALDATPVPGALVLWTDARTGGSPARLEQALERARQVGATVTVLGTGVEQPARLELRDMQAPQVVQAGERARALVRLRISGVDPARPARAEIRLVLEGEEVARDEINLDKDGDLPHGMVFMPPARLARPEGTKLEARVRVIDGAADPGDRLERRVTILDRPWRVLIVDQTPRWDVRFLLMHLSRDGGEQGRGRRAATVEASIVLLEGDRELTARPPFLNGFPTRRQDLFAFDAVLLGDVDKDKLGERATSMLRDFVEEGGGLIIQASPAQRSLGWINTPLGDLLPVELIPAATDMPPEGYKPLLSTWGDNHEALVLSDDKGPTAKVWRELPAWHWRAGVKRLKPGARPLLIAPAKSGDGATIMATQAFGRGQVAWLGDDETWRWRMNTGDAIFGRFWNQWVQWAVASRSGGPRPVRLTIDRPDPAPGQAISIRARVLDSSAKPLEQPTVPARLAWLDAPADTPRDQIESQVSLRAIPGQPGEFSLTRIADRPGRFQIQLSDREGPALAWRVFPRDDLEPRGGLAVATAREISSRTGGEFLRETDAATIGQRIRATTASWTAPVAVPALNPLSFLIFVVALCTEWTVRRRHNLS